MLKKMVVALRNQYNTEIPIESEIQAAGDKVWKYVPGKVWKILDSSHTNLQQSYSKWLNFTMDYHPFQ